MLEAKDSLLEEKELKSDEFSCGKNQISWELTGQHCSQSSTELMPPFNPVS